MKKLNFTFIFIFIITNIYSCTGYEPIFNSSKINFKISDYTIEGNKVIGKKIFSKLDNLLKYNQDNEFTEKINIFIKVKKNKKATVKNTSGKILEYRVELNTFVKIENAQSNAEILKNNFNYFSSYQVQDQQSETLKLENKIIENLLDNTYQNLVIKIIEIQ